MNKNYVVIVKHSGEAGEYPAIEVTDKELFQWIRNGSIQDGDVVYEVVNKRIAKKQDIILEPT